MAATRRTSGYWVDFPATYRAEQIALIMRWLAAGESGAVVGYSGTGKSNLAGFLSSRPDVTRPLAPDGPERYRFLLLDANTLPALTAPFFFRGMVQKLEDAAPQFGPDVEGEIRQLIRGQNDWADLFAVLVLLQKLHRRAIYQAGGKIIWLLDRFDEACRRLEAQTLNSLRSLRDQFKGQLCFLVFTRHPLARLREPGEIDEFHEIIAANTCWVGPMVERDARWIARQMADRLRTSFSEREVLQLIEVSGGLPAFMKLACSALAEGALGKRRSTQAWAEQLLARPEFQRHCQEIWDDLSTGE